MPENKLETEGMVRCLLNKERWCSHSTCGNITVCGFYETYDKDNLPKSADELHVINALVGYRASTVNEFLRTIGF